MAALDFPDNPNTGDIFGSAGTMWRWDGTRWATTSSFAGAKGVVCPIKYSTGQISIVNNGTQYNAPAIAQTIPAKAGRTYRASASLGWTTTQQVADEGAFSACIVFDGALKSFAPVSVTSQFGAVYSARVEYVWTQVADATIAMTVNGNCVISPSGAANGLIWSSATMPWWSMVEDITMEIGSSGALDTATADSRYVNVTGDTLTGQLKGITPVAAEDLTRKDYVDKLDWNSAWGLRSITSIPNNLGNGVSGGYVAIVISAAFFGRPWVAGRRHRITFQFCFSNNTAADFFQQTITQGSGAGGAAVGIFNDTFPTINNYAHRNVTCVDSGGNYSTWTFGINRLTGGSGNMTIVGTNNAFNQFTVEDIGPVTPL